jgi:hypothetical protein
MPTSEYVYLCKRSIKQVIGAGQEYTEALTTTCLSWR